MHDEISSLWRDASEIDAKLRVRKRHLPLLAEKRVLPRPYSRDVLFRNMGREPVIFTDFHVRGPRGEGVAELIRNGFHPKQTARVQAGPSRYRTYLRVPDLMRRWSARRTLVSVTDLHIRGTRLETDLGVETLSDFNLLPAGSERMNHQEMMTLVIGAAGNVTNSHSDDPDGSNHCFMGRKLWLAWETFEGRAAGLGDDSRYFEKFTRFDLDAFLSLSSSCWWTVSEGQTLFLPGKLTHRVITLEHYLGVGSFFVALPSCVTTIARWMTHGPLWSLNGRRGNDDLVEEIARAATLRIRSLCSASSAERERWGADYTRRDAEDWETAAPHEQRAQLMRHVEFAELFEAARA